jgi:hypothetical protein
MKIQYRQGKGIALYFPVSELKVALGILKAIYTIAKLPFVKEAIDDLEDDLLPRKLPFVNHHHFCESCFTEIDDRVGDNFVHYTSDKADKWKHKICPSLKQGRPN